MTYSIDSELDRRQNWELVLEAERVIKTFDRTIEKLQIALCLPALMLIYPFILKSRLTPEQYEAVEKCQIYLPLNIIEGTKVAEAGSNSLSSEESSVGPENIRLMTTTGSKFPNMYTNITYEEWDLNVAKAVDYLINIQSVRIFCERIIHKISPEGKIFLSRLRILRQRIKDRLLMTPINHYKKECDLRACYVQNEHLKEAIQKLEDQLAKKREEHNKLIEEKEETLNQYHNELYEIQKSFTEKFTLRINKNESTMVNNSKESEKIQEDLSRVLNSVKNEYEDFLRKNLENEKQLEVRRHKAESQLISWLGKFDNDMFEHQHELDEVEGLLEAQREQYRKLEEKFNRQEEDYVRLMKDKAAEDERLHQKKILDFTLNHAACIIQRAWRAHWRRKLARRRARKKETKNAKQVRRA